MCLLLNKKSWIAALCADRAEASYKLFIANVDVKNQMKEFNMGKRLGMFYISCLSGHVELREVVKLVIISSHGNARVESGFSVSEEILVKNMPEDSLVAQRMVFDGVMNEGGISNVDVNRKMLKFVNNAHSEYVKQLEKQKEQQTLGEKKKRAKKSKNTKEVEKIKKQSKSLRTA